MGDFRIFDCLKKFKPFEDGGVAYTSRDPDILKIKLKVHLLSFKMSPERKILVKNYLE